MPPLHRLVETRFLVKNQITQQGIDHACLVVVIVELKYSIHKRLVILREPLKQEFFQYSRAVARHLTLTSVLLLQILNVVFHLHDFLSGFLQFLPQIVHLDDHSFFLLVLGDTHLP